MFLPEYHLESMTAVRILAVDEPDLVCEQIHILCFDLTSRRGSTPLISQQMSDLLITKAHFSTKSGCGLDNHALIMEYSSLINADGRAELAAT
jgi:hypothetical protein